MKKLISIIAILTACVSLTACNNAPEVSDSGKHRFEGLTLVNGSKLVDYVSLTSSFEELEKDCDFVVVGEFIEDPEVCYERYEYDAHFQKNVLLDIISSCPMRITKVLSGDAKVGDVVNVIQSEGIWEDRFITDSPLTPMQKGDEWVFCLGRAAANAPYDGYWCAGRTKGRFPTSNVGSNEKRCFSDYPELGFYDKNDFQEDFYNQLLEKYEDLI